jgi:hypothetical protein
VAAVLCLSVLPARAAAPFDGERALAWIVAQCELGPRAPGSPGHAELQRRIAAHADSLGLRFHRLDFTAPDPASGVTLQLANLVILAGEGEGPALWIGAHYDTRPVCDRDPDPARVGEPLTGANDGASGVAVLLHLAELMAADPPPQPVALLFFDGEDSGLSGSLVGYCLGARHLAATWNGFGGPLAGPEPVGLIVLDMVGERNLHVPMESISLQHAPELLRGIFGRAAELGLDAFAPYPGPPVFDDHVPFLRAGIPAVDLIDFDFPEWHTTGDVPAVCSAESLRQVGTLVWDLVRRPLD